MAETDLRELLCDCFEKKIAVFQYYLSITNQMEQAIENTKEKQFRRLILERQQCIKKIRNIDESIKKTISNVQGNSSFINIVNNLTRQYISKIKEIIDAITPLEEKLLVRVNSEYNDLKTALLGIQHTRNAAKSYGKKPEHSPRLLNARS